MDMLQHIHLNNMGVQKIGKQAHLKKNWGGGVKSTGPTVLTNYVHHPLPSLPPLETSLYYVGL